MRAPQHSTETIGQDSFLMDHSTFERACSPCWTPRANATQMTESHLLQNSRLSCAEGPCDCGSIDGHCGEALGRERVHKGAHKDGCRLRMDSRRPADASVDGGALTEDDLCRVQRLAAVEDDEAKVGAVRVDDGHEQVRRDGHQSIRGEPILAREEEHVVAVHLKAQAQGGMMRMG